MNVCRQSALAVVSEWLQSTAADAPQAIAEELSKCSRLYSSLKVLESLPAPAQPPEPWSMADDRSNHFKNLLDDLNECFYREESGKLFLGLSGELFTYNEAADRAATRIRAASEIELAICTRGGSAYGAKVIVEALQEAEKRDVHSVATIYYLGLSAGALILQAATHRRMAADAHLMIHRVATLCGGTPTELRKQADESEKSEENIIQLIWKRTGLAKTIVRRWFDGRNHYFDSESAKRFNLVDEIIPECGDLKRPNNVENL